MKLAWLTLPLFLAAGIACALIESSAAFTCIAPRSEVEALVNSYIPGATANSLLGAGIRRVWRTGPVNLSRSMWGQ